MTVIIVRIFYTFDDKKCLEFSLFFLLHSICPILFASNFSSKNVSEENIITNET